MNLEEKIELVKTELLKRHPNCHHTIKILLWDDGTDLVECRYGDAVKLYCVRLYDNQLTYIVDDLVSSTCIVSKEGKEYAILTHEEMLDLSSKEVVTIL